MEHLLLHVCCGPDLTYAYEYFSKEYSVTGYFANDNIDTEEEYEKRFYQAKIVADHYKFMIIKKIYEPEKFLVASKNLENEREMGRRCEECHRMNFRSAVEKAKEINAGLVSTTLTISPHKNAEMINRIGCEEASKKSVRFVEENLKKHEGFKKATEISKRFNLYRQNWCGCKFSRGTIG
ncbi:MAG: epoxyqueuosine reductase QueH [bacterium]|nr:epoxyqueuosine reductase QueH [bacterium]